jgi:hypothetical protein
MTKDRSVVDWLELKAVYGNLEAAEPYITPTQSLRSRFEGSRCH